ncbi:hypothetical protein H8356DRAFT_1421813 [Neocallimastix lanati (nom. inval.)]|nr:hypothetical protein H8356DRAFT_1421813 [Neocallimastix sp. JGI-2020a]
MPIVCSSLDKKTLLNQESQHRNDIGKRNFYCGPLSTSSTNSNNHSLNLWKLDLLIANKINQTTECCFFIIILLLRLIISIIKNMRFTQSKGIGEEKVAIITLRNIDKTGLKYCVVMSYINQLVTKLLTVIDSENSRGIKSHRLYSDISLAVKRYLSLITSIKPIRGKYENFDIVGFEIKIRIP